MKMTSRVTSEENSNGVTCISPTGENERGLKIVTRVMMPTGVRLHHHFSPHLTSPEGEGQRAMAVDDC